MSASAWMGNARLAVTGKLRLDTPHAATARPAKDGFDTDATHDF